MSSFTKKWSNRTAELHLPRPRTIKLSDLDSGPAIEALFNSYGVARSTLADLSQHQVTRWEAVGSYAEQLGAYAKVLGTHASTADPDFLKPVTDIPELERLAKIDALIESFDTRSQGLAAALIFPTYFSAVAVALTAFAVNDNSRQAFTDAQVALRRVDHLFIDYELLEQSLS
jgi:hypothetical protein